ncbi:MAG: hypothetical protein IIB30_05145 [Chloroflexi bacterium]|nr:hypothetical protein [Chloroflexota bacterium]
MFFVLSFHPCPQVVGVGLGKRLGATTRFSMISAPLRDRFGSVFRLDYYEMVDMQVIVRRSAQILELEADTEGLDEIAARSRGTPRIANRLLKRTRDYALVKADNRIDGDIARAALEQLSVDKLGLDQSDHRLLSSIVDKFDGGPVGLETLAAAINEDSDTIMDVLEPYMLQLGFLERTPRGRVATRRAYEYLGRTFPQPEAPDQGRLAGL